LKVDQAVFFDAFDVVYERELGVKKQLPLDTVACVCNPRYLGGGGRKTKV
jgi:hypothetical protein